MKKTLKLTLTLICISLFFNANAQLKMDCDGDVVIGSTTTTSDNALYVNGTSYTYYATSNKFYAYWGGFGTTNSSSYYRLKVASGTEYSIYTSGGIAVNGSIVQTSDKRMKKNIKKIDGGSALNKLANIEGTTYEFKDKKALKELHNKHTFNFGVDTVNYFDSEGKEKDSLSVDIPHFLSGSHYGLIAQDIEKEFPEMVSYDSVSKVYQVDYVSFVPVLIEATKEQQNEITALENKVSELENELQTIKNYLGLSSGNTKKSATVSTNNETAVSETCTLGQNSPNPFSEKTVIEAYVTESIQNANLYIYNMQGEQKQQITITDRGTIELTLNGGTLTAGVYLYALITDGALVDTKRMILTK